MASGLPVVGIAQGGVTDYLTHEHNSLLCQDGDVEAFTQNLITLMENETLRGELARNALKTALSRDWNEIFEALLKDYRKVIENNAKPR